MFFKKKANITFIFGSARGGTTWLWSLLESHTLVKPFTDNVLPNKNGLYKTSESGIYIKDRKNAKSKIKKFTKENKGFLIIEKTPSHTFFWNEIVKDFPNSKNIIILRHPIAIVNSMQKSKMTFLEGHTLEKSISLVIKYYKYLMEIVGLNRYHIVFYENLLLQTDAELSKIFEYLELDKTDITEIINNNTGVSKVDVAGVFRKGLHDSYLSEIDKDNLEYLEERLNSEINFFNSY